MNEPMLKVVSAEGPSTPLPAVEMVDVGGRRLSVAISGGGNPTVILETGLGAESSEWGAVERLLADEFRIVRYDRANRGASDPAPRPRRASDMLADLRNMLRAKRIGPPYVLVGHSFGGLLMRLFAAKYSGEVAGLVLVDSVHPDQFETFAPSFPPPTPNEPKDLAQVRTLYQGGWRDPASTVEGIDFRASFAEAPMTQMLGDLPMQVIVAGTMLNQNAVPAAFRSGLQSQWEGLQEQFVKLSTSAVRVDVPESSHFVQRDDPQSIVAAVRSVVAADRERNAYGG